MQPSFGKNTRSVLIFSTIKTFVLLMTAYIMRHYLIRSCSLRAITLSLGRDSSVGTATGYGLDGPGIESRWRGDFPHLSRPALGSTQSPVQWVPGL